MQFVVAIAASAAVVLVAPFMGQLQSLLRRSLSTRAYVLLFGVGVLAAVGAAILIAFVRIREQRARRFALLAAALALGGGYMWINGTPYPEVNAVERVHFVEYGFIAFLFYRAWKPAGDVSIIVMPLLCGFMVGTLDEWLQWFIPVRVGEAHDVFLNLTSLVCGLMFGFALSPPLSMSWHAGRQAWARIGAGAVMAWLLFATFVSQVHLGHAIDADGIGRFHSHYTADGLDALQSERAAKWATDPPTTLRRLSQEDQYLDEGLWHVRRRNVVDGPEAWRENMILERFFTPVLDTQTYASPAGNRWLPEQRANAEASFAAALTPAQFVSGAEPYPIVAWPKAIYWTVVAGVALVMLVTISLPPRRHRPYQP